MNREQRSVFGATVDTLGEYWPGFTDLMAGLVLIFVFLTVFAQIRGNLVAEERRQAEQEAVELREEAKRQSEQARRELEEATAGRTKAEQMLRKAGVVQLEVAKELEDLNAWKAAIKKLCENPRLREMDVDVDCQTGAIQLPDKVFFGFNEEQLTDDGRQRLREAMPIVLAQLRESPRLWNRVSVLEVRGHADPTVRHGPAYETNLRKSQARAYAVLHFLSADSAVPPEDRRWFEDKGVASGVAHKRPPSACATSDEAQCHDAMRRVELLVGFDDADVRKRFDDLLTKVDVAFQELRE